MLGRTNAGGSGGGSSLNFKVVGNPQPETAKENTIWVDAETISGWVFSATAPEAPQDNMVWIQTITASPVAFNALKKNSIMVYPLSAKQYVGGAWVDKTAKTWKGNAWTDWATWLYDSGNEFTALTGGWAAVNRDKSNTTTSGSSVTKNEDHIYTKNVSGGSRAPATANKIDLTPYKAIHALFSGRQLGIWVADAFPHDSGAYTAMIRAEGDDTQTVTTEAVLDISAVNKQQFVAVGDGHVSGVKIYKVWLV